MAPLAKKVTFS